MARGIDSNNRVRNDPLPSPCPQLRINTKLEEGTEDRQTNKRRMSMGSEAYPAHEGPRSSGAFLSPTRYVESPVSYVCDGWCGYNVLAHRTVVSVLAFSCCTGKLTFAYQLSLSACSDSQRAREGPRGSLTTVLCKYLGKHGPCSAIYRHIYLALSHRTVSSLVIPQPHVSY